MWKNYNRRPNARLSHLSIVWSSCSNSKSKIALWSLTISHGALTSRCCGVTCEIIICSLVLVSAGCFYCL
jgi:hypothetical protein